MMHARTLFSVLFTIMALGCVMLFGADAYAQNGGGQGGNCPGSGLIARIVPCITQTMEQSTTQLTIQMENYLYPAVAMFITLTVVLFGIKSMSPEGAVQRTGIPYLLKVGFVLLFLMGFGGYIPAVHGTMNDTVDILSNALDVSSSCPASGGGGGGGGAGANGSSKIWAQFDCILGKLFGFEPSQSSGSGGGQGGGGGNQKLIASIFGLLAGFLFSGSFGAIAFLGAIGVLWTICLLIYRAVFSYLNGYMLACFMVIISPMFIPLILLQITGRYFQNWLQIFIGAFLLPLIVVGYSVFALSIYNKILFESDKAESIRQLMDKNYNESISSMRAVTLDSSLVNNTALFDARTTGRSADDATRDGNVANVSDPLKSGAQTIQTKVPNIDIQDQMGGKYQNKQDLFRQVFTDGAALIILGWILATGLETVMQIVMVIAGGVAAALMSPLSSMEKRMQQSLAQAEQSFKDKFAQSGGTDMSGIHTFKKAIDDGLQSFRKGISS
jgi:hypothetical protein